MAPARATYVFCVVAATTKPRAPRVNGPAGLGPTRLVDVERGLFLVVADAPMNRFSEAAINRGLGNLDWVSRAAVAHEAVVESFIDHTAVLPMKLFTIFATDERALEHIRVNRSRINAMVKRVANHQEWGVRVMLDRAKARKGGGSRKPPSRSGTSYLSAKKAQRDAEVELAERASETVGALYDRLESRARLAERRAASDLPVEGGPLLLDAAFLVPRSKGTAFRAMVAKAARALAPQGYAVTVSGPWPPYTFVRD